LKSQLLLLFSPADKTDATDALACRGDRGQL